MSVKNVIDGIVVIGIVFFAIDWWAGHGGLASSQPLSASATMMDAQSASSPGTPDTEIVDGPVSTDSNIWFKKSLGVHNLTGRTIATAWVSCGFFDSSGELLTTGEGSVDNIDSDQTGYLTVLADRPKTWNGRISATCRVSNIE